MIYRNIDDLIIKGPTSKLGVGQIESLESGDIKCFTSGGETFDVNQYLVDGEYVFMNDGGSADTKYNRGKSNYSNHVFAFTTKQESLRPKFLYYYLKNNGALIETECFQGVGLKNLNKRLFGNFKVPIPSLNKQDWIIKILDKFTTLEAELEARKKQYEFYLNKVLLEHDVVYEHYKLSKLCRKIKTITWGSDAEYDYVDLSSISLGVNTIGTTEKINSQNAPSRARNIINTDDVLFATTRPLQKRIGMVPSTLNNQICSTGYCVLRSDTGTVMPKYLYFNLQGRRFYKYVETVQSGTAYPAVSNSKVMEYKIPVPPIEKQKELVNILSNFEKIVNGIFDGLPAEIEARRKQYEYYRNKLLTFEESES